MRFEDFVAVYPRGRISDRRPSRARAEYRVFERFQLSYGRLLHDLLRGEEPTRTRKRFETVHAKFLAWAASDLDDLVRAVSPREGETDYSAVGGLVFGQLTVVLQDAWRQAFAGGRQDRVALRRMQLMVAALSVNIQRARDQAADAALARAAADSLRSTQWGMLTELDTALVLLELAKENRWLTVLPAPWAFEALAGVANADFVLLDLERREALGVQAKTRVRRSAVEHYHEDRVVLVDGWTDFGNARLVAAARRGSDKRLIAWPGLLSAHHLAAVGDRSQDMLRARDPAWLREKRERARELTMGMRDYRALAVRAVGDRVLPRFSRTAP